jgi:hypothetical protein
MQTCLNIVGLVLNMAGVGLMFKYGNPQPSFEGSVGLGLGDENVLADGMTVGERKQREKRRRIRYQCMSRVALGLLFVGFLFQFAALFAN